MISANGSNRIILRQCLGHAPFRTVQDCFCDPVFAKFSFGPLSKYESELVWVSRRVVRLLELGPSRKLLYYQELWFHVLMITLMPVDLLFGFGCYVPCNVG